MVTMMVRVMPPCLGRGLGRVALNVRMRVRNNLAQVKDEQKESGQRGASTDPWAVQLSKHPTRINRCHEAVNRLVCRTRLTSDAFPLR